MSDMYIDELEMRLRFAEEDTQERERLAFQMGKESIIDEMKDLIINTPSKMVINGQDYFSDFELSMMLKKLKEQKND